MKKRLFSLALALALCLGLTVPVSAVGQVKIASGSEHCAFIDANGDLWMWGRNINGQLGNHSTEDSINPVKIMSDVASVSLGNQISAAVKTDGTLWVWGRVRDIVGYANDSFLEHFREEGPPAGTHFADATWHPVDYVKYPLKLTDNVDSVSFGDFSLAVIKKDSSLWIWGDHNLYPDNLATGEGTKIMDNVSTVSVGNGHYAAIDTNGTLWMWGGNTYGQLGNGDAWTVTGDEEYHPAFVTKPFKLMDDVSIVRCGPNFTAAIKTDGTLWMWGLNKGLSTDGRLGRSISPNHSVTVPVLNGTFTFTMQTVPARAAGGIQDVAVTGASAIQLLNGGVVIQNSGGYQPAGSLAIYMTNAADISGFAAIKKDGTVWSWGAPVKTSGLSQPVQMDSLKAGPTTSGQLPSIPESPSNSNGFTDVKASDYFAEAVQWAVEQNITSGTSKTTFSPNATCSKAQILTFLWHANGSPEPTAATPFTDVKTADYFYKAALWAAEKGLVSGSTFGANADCTRAMTVEYMWKAAGSPAPAGKADFDDVPANADYAQAVAWAVEKNITSGTGDGNFSPTATCTRGQIVTFLYRAMGK